MKTTHVLTLLLSFSVACAEQAYKGFNLRGSVDGDGPMKIRSDWDFSFQRLKQIPGNFNAARLYSTTDINGTSGVRRNYLLDVLPSAEQHDTLLLVGLYLGNQNANPSQFDIEFQGLKDGIVNSSAKQIIGISVGNEDLYNKDWVTPGQLARQINTVRDWVKQNVRDCIPVGHTDTWDSFVEPSNQPVIDASDFLTANIFPYWENATIDQAKQLFTNATGQVMTVSKNNADVPVWLGETGWANADPLNVNPSVVASVANLQTYWDNIACGDEFNAMNSFYYIDADAGINNLPSYNGGGPEFGVFAKDHTPIINLTCPASSKPVRPSMTSALGKRWWRSWSKRQASSAPASPAATASRQTCQVKVTSGTAPALTPSLSASNASTVISSSTVTVYPVISSSNEGPVLSAAPFTNVTFTTVSSATEQSPIPTSATSSLPVGYSQALPASVTTTSAASITAPSSLAAPTVTHTVTSDNTEAAETSTLATTSPPTLMTDCTGSGNVVSVTTFVTQTVLVTETDYTTTIFVGATAASADTEGLASVSTSATTAASNTESAASYRNSTRYFPIMYTERTISSSQPTGTTTVHATLTNLATVTIEMLGNGSNAVPETTSSPVVQMSLTSSSDVLHDTSITVSGSATAAASAISSMVAASSATDAAASSTSPMNTDLSEAFASAPSTTTNTWVGNGLAVAKISAATDTPSEPAENRGWDPRRVATVCGTSVPCTFQDSSAFYASHTPMPSNLGWPKAVEGLV